MTGYDSPVHYNGGEVRTAVGDFNGDGVAQIATAQGIGGNGVIRLFQYTGLPKPDGWLVVGQFDGLAGNAKTGNATGGLTLAAGDLNGDGSDELLVGQTNGPSSQTIFHVLEIHENQIAARHPYAGFIPKFRGDGGVELAVADLDGDGMNEIIAASQGNSRTHGDSRDTAPINVISIIQPVIEEGALVGFTRPDNSVMSVFSELTNPSGAMSIAAGEFNGNPLDGAELIVGTGCLREVDDYTVTPIDPAPESRYRIFKVKFDGTAVQGIDNFVGNPSGFTAFVGENNPTSGAVHVSAMNPVNINPVAPTATPKPAPPTPIEEPTEEPTQEIDLTPTATPEP